MYDVSAILIYENLPNRKLWLKSSKGTVFCILIKLSQLISIKKLRLIKVSNLLSMSSFYHVSSIYPCVNHFIKAQYM